MKYHFCPFLMEDFYIFIFFAIYWQGNISLIFITRIYIPGVAFRGRKFRIFLEKAIIDVKYHSRPFLMEDFYIFIFFVIYRQGNISNIFFVIFRREKISFSF